VAHDQDARGSHEKPDLFVGRFPGPWALTVLFGEVVGGGVAERGEGRGIGFCGGGEGEAHHIGYLVMQFAGWGEGSQVRGRAPLGMRGKRPAQNKTGDDGDPSTGSG